MTSTALPQLGVADTGGSAPLDQANATMQGSASAIPFRNALNECMAAPLAGNSGKGADSSKSEKSSDLPKSGAQNKDAKDDTDLPIDSGAALPFFSSCFAIALSPQAQPGKLVDPPAAVTGCQTGQMPALGENVVGQTATVGGQKGTVQLIPSQALRDLGLSPATDSAQMDQSGVVDLTTARPEATKKDSATHPVAFLSNNPEPEMMSRMTDGESVASFVSGNQPEWPDVQIPGAEVRVLSGMPKFPTQVEKAKMPGLGAVAEMGEKTSAPAISARQFGITGLNATPVDPHPDFSMSGGEQPSQVSATAGMEKVQNPTLERSLVMDKLPPPPQNASQLGISEATGMKPQTESQGTAVAVSFDHGVRQQQIEVDRPSNTSSADKGDAGLKQGDLADRNSKLANPDNVSSQRTQQSSGTAAATQDKRMNFDGKQNEIAVQGEQILPNRYVSAKRSGKIDQKPGTQADAVAGFPAVSTKSSPGNDSAGSVEPTRTRLPVLDRMNDMVLREASLMGRFKPDKLEVVLRPDSNTQIVLHLRMDDGVVQASAKCERGDFAVLNSHWGDLQKNLERQGIKMAPLAESGLSSGSGWSSQNHSQQNPNRSQTSDVPLSEMLIDSAIKSGKHSLEKAVLNAFTNDQLLQTWA